MAVEASNLNLVKLADPHRYGAMAISMANEVVWPLVMFVAKQKITVVFLLGGSAVISKYHKLDKVNDLDFFCALYDEENKCYLSQSEIKQILNQVQISNIKKLVANGDFYNYQMKPVAGLPIDVTFMPDRIKEPVITLDAIYYNLKGELLTYHRLAEKDLRDKRIHLVDEDYNLACPKRMAYFFKKLFQLLEQGFVLSKETKRVLRARFFTEHVTTFRAGLVYLKKYIALMQGKDRRRYLIGFLADDVVSPSFYDGWVAAMFGFLGFEPKTGMQEKIRDAFNKHIGEDVFSIPAFFAEVYSLVRYSISCDVELFLNYFKEHFASIYLMPDEVRHAIGALNIVGLVPQEELWHEVHRGLAKQKVKAKAPMIKLFRSAFYLLPHVQVGPTVPGDDSSGEAGWSAEVKKHEKVPVMKQSDLEVIAAFSEEQNRYLELRGQVVSTLDIVLRILFMPLAFLKLIFSRRNKSLSSQHKRKKVVVHGRKKRDVKKASIAINAATFQFTGTAGNLFYKFRDAMSLEQFVLETDQQPEAVTLNRFILGLIFAGISIVVAGVQNEIYKIAVVFLFTAISVFLPRRERSNAIDRLADSVLLHYLLCPKPKQATETFQQELHCQLRVARHMQYVSDNSNGFFNKSSSMGLKRVCTIGGLLQCMSLWCAFLAPADSEPINQFDLNAVESTSVCLLLVNYLLFRNFFARTTFNDHKLVAQMAADTAPAGTQPRTLTTRNSSSAQ